jgi:hypothetical protein
MKCCTAPALCRAASKCVVRQRAAMHRDKPGRPPLLPQHGILAHGMAFA